MMGYLDFFNDFFLVILISLLHIFRYLDPVKDIIRYSILFKISQDIFFDILVI